MKTKAGNILVLSIQQNRLDRACAYVNPYYRVLSVLCHFSLGKCALFREIFQNKKIERTNFSPVVPFIDREEQKF